jgi:hypothetical protein
MIKQTSWFLPVFTGLKSFFNRLVTGLNFEPAGPDRTGYNSDSHVEPSSCQ